jgi:hypothetical protein
MMLHYEQISNEMKSLLIRLMEIKELLPFRLVGGTSLALQLGHRTSVDIDLFAGGGAPAPEILSRVLIENFSNEVRINRIQRYGLAISVKNIKVDIYDWKVPFTQDPVEVDGIRLASIKDIFAFKCEALTGRKAEKDFIDIAEILLHYPLEELLITFQTRYPYYAKAAIMNILLRPDVFERDSSIKYAEGKSWEKYNEVIRTTLRQFEDSLEERKKKVEEEHAKKIQSLIDQKRKKQK